MTAVGGARAALAAALLGTLVLAGCTTNPATGESDFTAFMTPEEEAEIGRQEDARLTAEFGGLYRDAELQAYVTRVGERLVQVSETPAAPFRFKVLDDQTVNAFALPGGYVYVTRGLIALASDEAELAAVLGHEIGHVIARHSAQRHSRAQAADVGLTLFGVVAGVFGAPLGTGTVASVGASAVLQGHSREQERQADMLGLRYLRRAGYDGDGMVRFFEKLARMDTIREALGEAAGGGPFAAMMRSHPHTAERLETARELVREGGEGSGVPPTVFGRAARDDYLDRVDGVLYGHDLRAGAIRDGRYVSLADQIAFDAPPGFKLMHVGDTVTGDGPGGAVLAVDTRPLRTEPAGGLRGYVATVWAAALRPGRVETLRIGPYEAATADVRAVDDGRPRDLRFVVLRRPGAAVVHRFLLTTPPEMTERLDAAIRRVLDSARPPSPAEARAVGTMRVRVVEVGPGESRAALLGDMAEMPLKERRFDAINGLVPGAEPAAGSRVKLITRWD